MCDADKLGGPEEGRDRGCWELKPPRRRAEGGCVCVYGPVLRVVLPAQLSDPETELSCRLSDAAGIPIYACQTRRFCGRVSGL